MKNLQTTTMATRKTFLVHLTLICSTQADTKGDSKAIPFPRILVLTTPHSHPCACTEIGIFSARQRYLWLRPLLSRWLRSSRKKKKSFFMTYLKKKKIPYPVKNCQKVRIIVLWIITYCFEYILQRNSFLICFFWPCPRHVKIRTHRLNPHHSSNPSHCSDNARSLTHGTIREMWEITALV